MDDFVEIPAHNSEENNNVQDDNQETNQRYPEEQREEVRQAEDNSESAPPEEPKIVVPESNVPFTEPEKSERNPNDIDAELEMLLAKQKAAIKVVGSGGGGNNTINRISEVGITGAETIAVNTDAQDLLYPNTRLGRPVVGASSRKWTTLTATALKLRLRLGLLAGMTPGLA